MPVPPGYGMPPTGGMPPVGGPPPGGKKSKTPLIVAMVVAGVLVVALVAVIAAVVLGTGNDGGTAGGAAAQEEAADGSEPEHRKTWESDGDGPEHLQEDGSVVLAEKGADAPVVEVYADFQCPACQQFEDASGDTLQRLATDGEAIVHYRPVSIFSQQPAPLSSNSLRAAAAARAAADYGKFVEFSDLLFENQPNEGESGFSVKDLSAWGEDVGIDDAAFAERVKEEDEIVDTYVDDYTPRLTREAQDKLGAAKLSTMTVGELIEWGDDNGVDSSFLDGTYVGEVITATSSVSDRYSGDDAFVGTPSVYINGKMVDHDDAFKPKALKKAVKDASPGEVDTVHA
ncbi:DsbA family protein [Nocardiopsis gilva]|nr:thioredoxin domain-containing protein [Nocardiopsis gilva]